MGILQDQNMNDMAQWGNDWALQGDFNLAGAALDRNPFSSHYTYEQYDSTYAEGWGGNRYAPPGLEALFNYNTEQKNGPVWTGEQTAATVGFGSPQYMGPADGPASARGGFAHGNTLLAQLSILLNGPQARAKSNSTQNFWSSSPAANKFKSTFTRYKTSNRSAYNNLGHQTPSGRAVAFASGGAWIGYTPANPYHSSARWAASMLATVKMGGDLDWGDMTDQTDDGVVNYADYFVFNDMATGQMEGSEVNSARLVQGGFGIKEMMLTGEFTGKTEGENEG